MRVDDIPDDQLVGRVAAGEPEAFAELFRRRQALVYRFALHMTTSPAIAEDVTQEVFLAVMSDAGRYDPSRASVASWLCGIARNHVRRRAERDRVWQPLGDDDRGDDPDAIESTLWTESDVLGDLTKAESLEALRGAVATLPVRYREALVLCDLQEMSYSDAASAIGCAVGTVRSRLHRGRALLAVKLRADAAPTDASSRSQTRASVSDINGPLRSVRNLA